MCLLTTGVNDALNRLPTPHLPTVSFALHSGVASSVPHLLQKAAQSPAESRRFLRLSLLLLHGVVWLVPLSPVALYAEASSPSWLGSCPSVMLCARLCAPDPVFLAVHSCEAGTDQWGQVVTAFSVHNTIPCQLSSHSFIHSYCFLNQLFE